MASTIESSTLTVRISEEIELNGSKLGSSNLHKIKGINEVSKRIVTTLTSGTTLINLGAAAGPGTFVRSDVKYIRITNLDNSNYVRLALATDAGGAPSVHLKIPALDSFVLSAGLAATSADGAAVTFNNIDSIKAWANSASVDLEVFVALT